MVSAALEGAQLREYEASTEVSVVLWKTLAKLEYIGSLYYTDIGLI